MAADPMIYETKETWSHLAVSHRNQNYCTLISIFEIRLKLGLILKFKKLEFH